MVLFVWFDSVWFALSRSFCVCSMLRCLFCLFVLFRLRMGCFGGVCMVVLTWFALLCLFDVMFGVVVFVLSVYSDLVWSDVLSVSYVWFGVDLVCLNPFCAVWCCFVCLTCLV